MHALRLKVDWVGSKELSFEAPAGGVSAFEARAAFSPLEASSHPLILMRSTTSHIEVQPVRSPKA